jgi:hypothetical protein
MSTLRRIARRPGFARHSASQTRVNALLASYAGLESTEAREREGGRRA